MRVLFADDHEIVRDGLRPFLESLDRNTEVIEASSLEEAFRKADSASDIDLIVLDLMMPGMNGFKGIVKTAEKFSNVPIVVISGKYTRDDVMTAIDKGASGYLPKTMSGDAIANALRIVLTGENYIPPVVLTMFDDDIAGDNRFALDNPLSLLSERGTEILGMVVQGEKNKDIADTLGLKEVTIKLHVRGIFRKLGAKNRAMATRIALQNGWVS